MSNYDKVQCVAVFLFFAVVSVIGGSLLVFGVDRGFVLSIGILGAAAVVYYWHRHTKSSSEPSVPDIFE